MTRERMSRPSSSVPNQWVTEGDCRRACRWIAAGSKGAIQGAKIARVTKIANKMMPKIVSGWKRRDCIQVIVIDGPYRSEISTQLNGSRRVLKATRTAEGWSRVVL